MAFNFLDNWDIKRIKDNMNDVDMLLNVIDDLININCEISYDDGYSNGYEQGRFDTEEL